MHQGWGSIHKSPVVYKDCYIDSVKVSDINFDMDERCNKYDVEVVLRFSRMDYDDARELIFNSIGVECELKIAEQWYPTEEDRRKLND